MSTAGVAERLLGGNGSLHGGVTTGASMRCGAQLGLGMLAAIAPKVNLRNVRNSMCLSHGAMDPHSVTHLNANTNTHT